MKHTYIATEDIGEGLSIVDEKVVVSGSYLSKEDGDTSYQPIGHYLTESDADERYSLKGEGGAGFDGTHVGDSEFQGDMNIIGKVKILSLEDSQGRIIQSNKIATLDDIQSGGQGESTYTLPTATDSILGGVKIGSNINIASGVISVADVPIASANTSGTIKVGNGLSISNGVLSATSIGGSGGIPDGDNTINGNLHVVGNITYEGEIEKVIIEVDNGLPYKENSLKTLFENGKLMVGTPKTAGEITYNADGSFTDGAGYHGKLNAEGYLDLSVQNQIISTTNLTLGSSICMAYVEIVGKIGTANSIFAPLVRKDKATANDTFIGTSNGAACGRIGAAMTDGLNRLLFVPTSAGKGKVFVNGQLVGDDGTNCFFRIATAGDFEIMLCYSWASGGTGFVKKMAFVDYNGHGYKGDADGIEITTKGFKNTPISAIATLRAESELSSIKERLSVVEGRLKISNH